MMELIMGFVLGLVAGVVGASLYLHSHQAKFIAAVAKAYGKTEAEVANLKAKL